MSIMRIFYIMIFITINCFKSETKYHNRGKEYKKSEIQATYTEIPQKLKHKDLSLLIPKPKYDYGIKTVTYFCKEEKNYYLNLIFINTTLTRRNLIIGKYLVKYIDMDETGITAYPTEYFLSNYYILRLKPISHISLSIPLKNWDHYYALIGYVVSNDFCEQFFYLPFAGKIGYYMCKKGSEIVPGRLLSDSKMTFRNTGILKIINEPVVNPGDEIICTYYWKPVNYAKRGQSFVNIELKLLPKIKIYNFDNRQICIKGGRLVVTCPLDTSHHLDSLKFSFHAPYPLFGYKIYGTEDSLACFKFLNQTQKWRVSNQTMPVIITPLLSLSNIISAFCNQR